MGSVIKRELSAMKTQAGAAARTVFGAFAVLWVIEIIDLVVFGGSLDRFGVRPRTIDGLWGILFAPLLHGGLGHLIANTVAGVPLALFSMARKRSDFWVVTAVSGLTAGLGAWTFRAPGSVHVGASGVIFGYLGFLLGRGIFERRASAVLVSLLVGFLYGGMVIGVVPGLFAGVSWQSHLFGFVGGLLVSRTLGNGLRAKRGR